MDIRIEIDEKTLRAMVVRYLYDELGGMTVKADDVQIEVKSRQNYRSEWEVAAFRAIYTKHTAS